MPNIKIRISTGVKTAGDGVERQEEKGAMSKSDQRNMAVTSIFAHQMLATSKQALNTSISMIGVETGNYVEQQQIEAVMGLVSSAVGTGVAFATNPYLGIAKVAADVVSYGLKIATDIRKFQVNEKNADILRRRSGNSLTDGSRTGD